LEAPEDGNLVQRYDTRLTILRRGYSITRDAAGRIVRDAAQVSLGDDISIRLSRGELGATVRSRRPQRSAPAGTLAGGGDAKLRATSACSR
jgi:hypothetical protein